MAGRAGLLASVLFSGALLVLSAWVAGNGHAAVRSRAATPSVAARTTLDLRYGGHARGRVVVSARLRGSRISAVFAVSRLTLPALGARRRGALLITASSLCGGRFGVARELRSPGFASPAKGLRLPPMRASLPVGSCKRALPVGVFVRVRLVALKPVMVLHSTSGSIPSLRPAGAN